MSERKRQALHGGILFAVIMGLLDIFIFYLRVPPPGPGEDWVLLLGLVLLFPAAFAIWWLVFRNEKMAVWHALYAGVLIGLFWNVLIMLSLMLIGLVVRGTDAIATTALVAWAHIPLFILSPLDGALKFIVVALFVRWRQLKRVP